MRYIIYKALDNPPSFVGLKGSYIKIAVVGVILSGVMGLIAGGVFNGLVGVIVFIACAAAAYWGVMAFQARFTERELRKWLSSMKLMDVIVFGPESFSSLARRRLEAAERVTKKE